MNEMSIADKIRALAQKTAQEKIDTQKKVLELAAQRDISDIEKALSMIKERSLFKKIEKQPYGYQYVMATEEIFLDDYVNKQNPYASAGIHFSDLSDKKRDYCAFTVNGHAYYDMAFMVNRYERDLQDISKRAQKLYEQLSDAEREWQHIREDRFMVKDLLEQAHRNSVEYKEELF